MRAFYALLLASGMAAAAPFDPIASVLQHPRCLNCHTFTEYPKQGDNRVRHDQYVVRGPENHGAETLHCDTCHQDHNTADGRVPGAPHWHLAPLSMGWEGLTPGQLCASIKDPARNGGRNTLDKVVEHMKVDPLVTWAWDPGADRTRPPLTHPEFVQALEAWVSAGGPCPSP